MSKTALDLEPLLDSEQADKLLGNIHVKTLQGYAGMEACRAMASAATGVSPHQNWPPNDR